MRTLCLLISLLALTSSVRADSTVNAASAVVTQPLVLNDGAISQPQQTELAQGGKAIFSITLAQAGDYVIHAVVDAPAEDANSFYLNIDAQPEDPVMIWDIDVTTGFQERTVSWRGNGDANGDEFTPKVFKLSAGEHKVIVVGREPTWLKSLTISPVITAGAAAPGTLAFLQQRYAEADATYERELRKLTNTPEGQKQANELRRKLDSDHAEQFLAAVELAKANPKSDTGFAALEWVLKTVRAYYLPAGPAALSLMVQQYPTDPKIGGMLAILTYYFPNPKDASYPDALALLQAVAERNPDRTARGHAALGLAWLAKRKFQEAEWRGEPAELARVAAQTEKAFEAVVHDYGDCSNLRAVGARKATTTLGGEAESELRELRHLSIGQVAPEIAGEDLDGSGLKLSDSRGKVVLLVFWASWCGPCMAAVPHEKELVEHFKGRPFILIGVNGDTTKHDAAKAVTKKQIPWRSFWNGPEGPGGPIAMAWNVRGWPTIYVLDHQGVIRQKYLHGKWLDEPLEKMVAAAEQHP